MTTSYKVRAYTGKETPAEGNRLSILTYRQTEEDKKAKKAKKENKFVEIPTIDIDAELPKLNDLTRAATIKALQGAINDWQDSIIKTLIDSGGAQDIHGDKITLDAIIAHANAENSKRRMNKEGIAAWFDSDMLPGITEALVAKGITDEAKIAATCDNYSEAYQKLASVAPKINKTDAQKLIDLLKKLAPASSMRDDIAKKLELILAPEALDLEELI